MLSFLKKTDFLSRIDDSKKLTPKQREQAADELRKNSIFSVGTVYPATIDKINILQATIKAMRSALKGLSLRPDMVLIDGRINLGIGIPSEGIIGGDAKSLTIAAASIIAKVTRDNIMNGYDKLYPEYGFIRNKGYGTPEHMAALRRYGPSPIHRLSFAPLSDTLLNANLKCPRQI